MSRRSPLQASKNSIIYGGLLTASSLGRKLSLPVARRIGRRLGALSYVTLRREREKALRNLAIAFPDADQAERQRLARAMFLHLGTSLMEICWLPNLDEAALERTMIVEGLEHMQTALDAGRGVVLFSGHCGNWEWMAAAIGRIGLPMNIIVANLYDRRVNEFIIRSRAAHQIKSIGRGSNSSARETLQTLKKNEILGLLIDQSIAAESVDVTFFGRPAPTPVGPARLAIRSGAVAICGFIEREGDMQRLRFQPPIFTSRNDDPVELTQIVTSRIEEQIRRIPSQWVWMHDRWRKRRER